MGLRSPGAGAFRNPVASVLPVCGRPSARLELDGNARALDLYPSVPRGLLDGQRYRGAGY